jgi:hypothetical protein
MIMFFCVLSVVSGLAAVHAVTILRGHRGERWLSGTSEVMAERAGTVEAGGRKYADCLKLTYREPDGKRTTEEYLAPGVGMVKTVYTNTTPPRSTMELTLASYHL